MKTRSTCPVYLLAGTQDDITTKEPVFDAEKYLGITKAEIVKKPASGGHIGLFMETKPQNFQLMEGGKVDPKKWPTVMRWSFKD
mgnify:CR=1 FL=1